MTRGLQVLLCLLLVLTGTPALAHYRPENRVWGSSEKPADFASYKGDKPIAASGENDACGYDFALGLHKYLYGADNPVDNSDPSGNDYGDFSINISSILSPLINSSSSMLSSSVTSESGLGAFAGVGINVDVFIWEWKKAGVVGPGHSVGHAMVIDDGTQNVEVSQFPHLVGQPSTSMGRNRKLNYSDTFTEEDNRQPDGKFLVHLPNPTAFHAKVDNEVAREWWHWKPSGPNETQCARSTYDVLKAGGLPLWGYGDQGFIMPGWLVPKLQQFVNSQASGYSVKRIN